MPIVYRCVRMQERMSLAVVGELDLRSRLEVDAHAARCVRCASAYRDIAAAAVALGRAYAPLRRVSSGLSPARARLAARVEQPAPRRTSGLFGKLAEASLAAAVTAFAFGGSITPAAPATVVGPSAEPQMLVHVSRPMDDAQYFRWMRLGRQVPLPDFIDASIDVTRQAADAPTVAIPRERTGLGR